MIFRATMIAGVYVVELERHSDERGYFARTWSREELRAHGLVSELSQSSMSYSRRAGTLRGMHCQRAPHAETKLVRCARGAIYDVAVDLRPSSTTYRQWVAQQLTDQNQLMLYIPEGVAHGFQTLADDCEVCYHISAAYAPDFASGVRWDDPAFHISWPCSNPILSERDRSWPDFPK